MGVNAKLAIWLATEPQKQRDPELINLWVSLANKACVPNLLGQLRYNIRLQLLQYTICRPLFTRCCCCVGKAIRHA